MRITCIPRGEIELTALIQIYLINFNIFLFKSIFLLYKNINDFFLVQSTSIVWKLLSVYVIRSICPPFKKKFQDYRAFERRNYRELFTSEIRCRNSTRGFKGLQLTPVLWTISAIWGPWRTLACIPTINRGGLGGETSLTVDDSAITRILTTAFMARAPRTCSHAQPTLTMIINQTGVTLIDDDAVIDSFVPPAVLL